MLFFLKHLKDNVINGCVYLEKRINKLYLGMLSVSPQTQAQGTGKKLIQAAGEFAKEVKCDVIEMTVISVRRELIAWYERNGYRIQAEHSLSLPMENLGRPDKTLNLSTSKRNAIIVS